MKLQLLVPHYKEPALVLEPLLNSVAIQQAINFDDIGVIIAYDGQEAFELPEEEWNKKYPFKIKYIKCEHNGVSATRNAALDAATAKYVMFCDADDMFCDVCGLSIIFNEMEKGFDTLVSVFREESRHPETKEIVYINREMDSTFVHGKIHRRQYLIDKNIRFNPKLTIHEDSFFNILAQNLTSEAKYCPFPFYLWKWRDESVCRHDPKYILKTYNNMLDSNDALIDEFYKRGHDDKAIFYTGFMIFDAYYTMNKKEWVDVNNKEYRDAVEKRFVAYYTKHKHRWDKISDEEKAIISNGVRTRSIGEGMPMETMTIDQWLDHITKLKND